MSSGVLRIAAQETGRYARGINTRVLLLVVAVGILIAFAGPALRERGVHPDRGLYRVEVNRESSFFPVVASDAKFVLLPGLHGDFGRNEADLLIVYDQVYFHEGSDRSKAAVRELQLSARAWLDRTLATEKDEDAAFPVRVNVVYEPRALGGGASAPAPPSPSATVAPTQGTAAPTPQLLAGPGEHQLGLRPSQVQPPFPIHGLLLTFAFVVPLNFVSQLYGGSILGERIRQRGILLLSTPHSRGAIVLGKSLPYLAFTVAAAAATSVAIGAGWLGFLAALPVIAFGLASTLLLSLLARSQRELTFFLVAITVLFSTFLFLPAIFTQIHPVAFLSPVSVIVASIGHQAVPPMTVAYATLPLALAAAVLVALSIALYKEETMFAPRTVLSKLVDGVHAVARTRGRLFWTAVLAVPFAIGLEVFVLIFAVTLDLASAFALFLAGAALVEETLKGLLVYAHIQRAATPRPAWAVGLVVGVGFFVGEKVALIFSLVGFDLLPRGTEALATYGIGTGLPILLAPLLLHVVGATITALGARRGGATFAACLLLATVVHAAYNVVLVLRILRGAV